MERRKTCVSDADTLLSMAAEHSGIHSFHFWTPTAFKSKGGYVNLPTPRFIVQSLMKKWNGCVTECPIEDEDNKGMEAMASGLRCQNFRIHDKIFHLKGNSIPGFTGELTLDNQLSGFQWQLLNAMLLFADYSGIGIKTTLGMGGVEHVRMNTHERYPSLSD